MIMPVHLFYQEPDPDRWLPGDRYPRRLIRRLVRGPYRPGGQMRVFLNLCIGLQRLGVCSHINDFKSLSRDREAVACVLGKAPFFFGRQWENPILLGPCVLDHPLEAPDLLKERPNVRRLLVPGQWMVEMFKPYFGDIVHAWPIGIDTDCWSPNESQEAGQQDVLIYDKLRWNRHERVPQVLSPICDHLLNSGLSYQIIRYGQYRPETFLSELRRSKIMVFICEHEKQGLAYQQALSCNVPVLAWTGPGVWEDPRYYPGRLQYGPVTSTPYWSAECGEQFSSIEDFGVQLDCILSRFKDNFYCPRKFVLRELSLYASVQAYFNHVSSC